MNTAWFPPQIQPFERLQVNDGLLIDSKLWQVAHEYHRQRQNVHYQSLNQAGIVCGLGVRLIDPPKNTSSEYLDRRWVQVQPGIAIDQYGNLIVVDKPIDFRIASKVITEEFSIIYLVVRYVDPSQLQLINNQKGSIVTEQFRIDEKNTPPSDREVEVCRICITPGEIRLELPQNVFSPRENQLDLRYRIQAKWRPLSNLRVGICDSGKLREVATNDSQCSNISFLLQSLTSLYPNLGALPEVDDELAVTVDEQNLNKIAAYDLISFTDKQLQTVNIEAIKKYLNLGGNILIEVSTENSNIGRFAQVKQELQQAIADTVQISHLSQVRQVLEDELVAITTDLQEEIQKISETYSQILATPLQSIELWKNHPLRTTPFLFDALPTINKQPVTILNGGGVIIVIGNLSSAWGLNSNMYLPREIIRNAQEMGINILNFAWRRKQLTQLSFNNEYESKSK